jgi:hypothetical protein
MATFSRRIANVAYLCRALPRGATLRGLLELLA